MKKPKTGKTKMITFCPVIQDCKTAFKYENRQNLGPEIYIYEYNIACKLFLRIFNEFNEILKILTFTGRYFGLISYEKTVLESCMQGYIFRPAGKNSPPPL